MTTSVFLLIFPLIGGVVAAAVGFYVANKVSPLKREDSANESDQEHQHVALPDDLLVMKRTDVTYALRQLRGPPAPAQRKRHSAV